MPPNLSDHEILLIAEYRLANNASEPQSGNVASFYAWVSLSVKWE